MTTERRLFAETLPEQGGRVVLDADASKHARVLRIQPGDAVRLFDGRGAEAVAVVEEVGASVSLRSEAVSRVDSIEVGRPEVHLVLGLPKAGKLDDILRGVTELGVHAVYLAICDHTVATIAPSKLARKQERWARVVREAVRQSERPYTPTVHPPRPLLELARERPAGSRGVVFAARAASDAALPLQRTGAIYACVGPEGGFSSAEQVAFDDLGFGVATLGPSVLRVETAALASVAVLLNLPVMTNN